MNKILLALLGAALIIAACKKDKYSTRPAVSFLSYEPGTLDSSTQQLFVKFNVKDGDGDIENAIFLSTIIGSLPNRIPDSNFTKFDMPSIEANRGNNINAEVTVKLITSDFKLWSEPSTKKDSFRIKVYLKDKSGNTSDTIYTKWAPIYPRKRP